jgi:hypothetical protein
MGLQAECFASAGRKRSRGSAHLDTVALEFRGGFKLSVPLNTIRSAEAKRGVLTVEHAEGRLSLDLGPAAGKWALKIRYPKTRIDKLGIKAESRVFVAGVDDPAFEAELRETGAVLASGPSDCDFILAGFTKRAHLAALRDFETAMRRNGAIWVVWPKGNKALTEDDIRNSTRAIGLTDVKVMSFSDTHSGLKLVIPVARRNQVPQG